VPGLAKEEELYKLRGKTLQVYIYLLRRGEGVGVRELQRKLGFSSPSIAHHHLEKLREMGLVSKDQSGRYVVSEKVDVGILKMFMVIGGKKDLSKSCMKYGSPYKPLGLV